MKKLLLSIIISLFLCTGVYAGPWISGGSGSGDVTAASTAQTWGDGTGPVVWTFSVTGTDPTISVATGGFTFNTDLIPSAADTHNLGSAAAEWANLYLGDGAIIAGQNDTSNTITSSSVGWTFAKRVSAPTFVPSAAASTGGQFGYDSNAFSWFANSEDITMTAGANLWTFDSNTAATVAFTPSVALNGGASVGGALALGANNLTMTGSLGTTGSRLTKGWFTDLEVTNAIAGSVTGNAGTATALAADPANCAAGQIALGVNASGVAECTATPTGLTSVGATTFTGALTGTASGNIANTLADAAGDMIYATADNTWARLPVGATNTLLYVNSDTPAWLALGAANTVLTSNGSALAWAATHSHSDSAAQFYNATNTTRLIKADASGITADSKTYTIKPITDVDVTFSPGKTFTDTKWCSFGTATGLTCNEDAPVGSGDITAVGSCATGSCASIGNADTSGGYIDFLEDSDNGTNYVRLKAPDSTADATITLPGTTGTLAILGANTFTADQTLNTTSKVQFGDSGTYINQSADGILNIATDTEVKILVNDEDIKFTKTGTNGITLGTNTATSKITTALAIASSGEITGLIPPVVVALSSGVHDGGNDQATMTDGGIDLGANTLIGMTVYNVTDGSSCTITANAATTITCTLAGGTGNDWDDNDVWQVGPGPYQSGSMFMVAGATTIRHPATAGYTACYMAEGTNKLTIDMASDSMVFSGVLDAAVVTLDAGDSIDSSDTTTDDFICLFNKSATVVKGLGKRGTWADGGAS